VPGLVCLNVDGFMSTGPCRANNESPGLGEGGGCHSGDNIRVKYGSPKSNAVSVSQARDQFGTGNNHSESSATVQEQLKKTVTELCSREIIAVYSEKHSVDKKHSIC
jgi:hypothetical protein